MDNGSISWNTISHLQHSRIYGTSLENETVYGFMQLLFTSRPSNKKEIQKELKPYSTAKLDGIIRRQRSKGIIE